MTPNSEGSQDEDDCSSLFGCMTSAAVSCLSGDTSSQQHAPQAMSGETPPNGQHNQPSTSGNVPQRSGGKNGGKRSKEQKTTRVRILHFDSVLRIPSRHQDYSWGVQLGLGNMLSVSILFSQKLKGRPSLFKQEHKGFQW